jgi:hypothetical protein
MAMWSMRWICMREPLALATGGSLTNAYLVAIELVEAEATRKRFATRKATRVPGAAVLSRPAAGAAPSRLSQLDGSPSHEVSLLAYNDGHALRVFPRMALHKRLLFSDGQ